MVLKYNIEIEACFDLQCDREEKHNMMLVGLSRQKMKNGLVCNGLKENDGM